MKRAKTYNKDVNEVFTTALKFPTVSMKQMVTERLFYFIQYFWDTYSDDEFIPNWHIEKICNELEIVARRVAENKPKSYDLIINVPPGTTKTAMVSIFFPIWCWVNWFHLRFITTSHSSTLSLESAEYSRDIIKSDKFKAMFPELDVKQDKDTKSNFRLVKYEQVHEGRRPRVKTGGGRVSTSVDAKIIGFHAHIIIPDDIIDSKGSLSDTVIKNTNRYLDHTLSTRKVDKKVTVMIMIMQRLHQNDPTGHLLAKKKKNIKHICLPAEIVNYKEQLQPQEWASKYKDGLLDAKRMDWAVLKDMEADLGQYAYSGQFGQKPTPPQGGMFQVARINILHAIPSAASIVQTIRYWDKAATSSNEKKDSCYTVGVKLAINKNNQIIILDVKRGQWSSNVREEIIRNTAEADGQNVLVGIEQEPGSGGKESAQSTIRSLVGYNVVADRPSGDKAHRADPFSVQVNNGNVFMLYGDWNSEYIKELENFPYSRYKDQVDASSGGFNIITGRKLAGTFGGK